MAESRYDYSTTVAILSHTAVFKQGSHPRYGADPVALKVTATPLPVQSGHDAAHPTPHEARVYALLCPHPSIPTFVECEEDLFDTSRFFAEEYRCGVQRLPILVTQFVKAASVDRFFLSFPVIRWSVVVRVARDVAAVLQHVHSKGVVYGDLKLPNVLLGNGGRTWLVDFASAVVVGEAAASASPFAPCEARGGIRREELARGVTLHMRAPELFPSTDVGNDAYNMVLLQHPFMVDFWSFGALLLELLTGRPCLGSFAIGSGTLSAGELQAKVLEGWALAKRRYNNSSSGTHGPHQVNTAWEALKDMLTGLLQHRPEQRLGFSDGWDSVLQHRFFECVKTNLKEPFPEEYDDEISELLLGL
ncbi:putative protein kinase [Trypanosoma grayi]|uniref:putative protein kinase n=1 Tax=Trypanosoma grayi TaxID=71804 RepID=UPI0004F40F28|nr:putative protein kinase [Trypanosoma grayi]KEG07279.1 putative protein kinase [Trypanosoma grayi]